MSAPERQEPRAADRYAVLGHPISHSLSPRIHAMFAQQTGQRLSYAALDVAPEQLAATIRGFFAEGGCGLNITVPHKQAVTLLLDGLTDRAAHAAAVNTVWRAPDGTLRGDNTDGAGLLRDFDAKHILVRGRRVLLVGAGGAAAGILAPLLARAPAELVLVNRTPERARALAAAQGDRRVANLRVADFGSLSAAFDLVINASAASLQQTRPPLPAAVIGAQTVCYDLGYAATPTPFVQWCREQGAAQAHMGLGMLVEQAAEAFELWRGVRPDTGPVLAELSSAGVSA